MPEFVLDTSGCIYKRGHLFPPPVDSAFCEWARLDAFTQGYIEALFYTENEPRTTRKDREEDIETWDSYVREGSAKEIPGDYGFSDLAPETLARIIEDCRKFQDENRACLLEAWDYETGRGPEGSGFPSAASSEQAGRDFWYTRNGHGCGFWDGDWPEPYASELDKAAKAFGQVDAYLGDDGKVYLS